MWGILSNMSDYTYRMPKTIPKVSGRPKKFQTVEELETAIQNYFNSCFIQRRERIKIKNENDDGYEYVDSPVTDATGEPVFDQIRPFTVTGLAVALDTTRDLLLDYEKKPENAIFSDTIKKAKEIIHRYAEEYLFDGKNQTGAIFNLKNNWGWVDRSETLNANMNLETDSDKVKTKVDDMFTS
jgi:hypothetical protein